MRPGLILRPFFLSLCSDHRLALSASVVAVTGLSEDDSTVSETGTLFSAVISKPITKETMLAVLLKLGFKVESLAASAAA